MIRDFTDAAECCPGQHWAPQARRALSGLIKAWHDAVADGRQAIPADAAGPMIAEFRRAVTVGLAAVPRIPGPKNKTKQPQADKGTVKPYERRPWSARPGGG